MNLQTPYTAKHGQCHGKYLARSNVQRFFGANHYKHQVFGFFRCPQVPRVVIHCIKYSFTL